MRGLQHDRLKVELLSAELKQFWLNATLLSQTVHYVLSKMVNSTHSLLDATTASHKSQ